MNLSEYQKVKELTYSQYCNYLIEKYGVVEQNYYNTNWSANRMLRNQDGLFCHHIDEYEIANLSKLEVAKQYDYEYQTKSHLVYCDYLEHLLLHILIGEEKGANSGLGFGGAVYHIVPQLNQLYSGYDADNKFFSLIKEDENVFIELKERLRESFVLLEHNEILYEQLEQTLQFNDRALVVLGTGLGKTTTGLQYLRTHKIRGLVLCPNKLIQDGWSKEADVDAITYAKFMNNYDKIDYSKYGLIICDEAHHCTAARWGEGIRYVLDKGIIKVVGLTATPRQDDKKGLKELEGTKSFFNQLVCEGCDVLQGIEKGILHTFSYVSAIYDTKEIRKEYEFLDNLQLKGKLDLVLNNTPTVKEILLRHMPQNKRKGIIFVSDIESIAEALDIMRDVYPHTEYRAIHSKLSDAENQVNKDWFENTDEGYLISINMISEGAHYRGVNTLIMLRKTASELVFNQQLGRVITLAKNENPQAIVFDLLNNAYNVDTESNFAEVLEQTYDKIREQNKEKSEVEISDQVIVADYSRDVCEVLREIKESQDDAWQEWEDEILRQYYPTEGAKGCYERLKAERIRRYGA